MQMAVTYSEILLQDSLDQKRRKALDICWGEGDNMLKYVACELDISNNC